MPVQSDVSWPFFSRRRPTRTGYKTLEPFPPGQRSPTPRPGSPALRGGTPRLSPPAAATGSPPGSEQPAPETRAAGVSLFYKGFYTVTPLDLQRISRGEKSRVGSRSAAVGARTLFLGETRGSSPRPRRSVPARFGRAVRRGRFVLARPRKPHSGSFPSPSEVHSLPSGKAPPANKGCPRPSAPARRSAAQRTALKRCADGQNRAAPTERKFPRDDLLGAGVAAALSFWDTVFLLTPENFPLERAINQQRRQQLWRRRRSSEKGRSFFHLLEENKGGEKGKLGAAPRRAGPGRAAGQPAAPGTAPEGCAPPRRTSGFPVEKKMWKMPRIGARVWEGGRKRGREGGSVCVCVCVRARLQSGDSGN